MARGLVGLVLGALLACAPHPASSLAWRDYRIGDLSWRRGFPRPAMVLFTSAQCWFCDQMDRLTFPHRRIVTLGRRFTLIKVDLSAKRTAPARDWLVHSYDIRKTPTVIFLDKRGRELKWLRLAGFAWPDTLSRHMSAALAATVEPRR
jgi:thiol:disulfide interchange protein